MSVAFRLCWVVINSVPYHAARLRAAVKRLPQRLCMVQLAGLDAFRALQQPVDGGGDCERRILLPEKPWHEIDKGAMVQRLQGLLN